MNRITTIGYVLDSDSSLVTLDLYKPGKKLVQENHLQWKEHHLQFFLVLAVLLYSALYANLKIIYACQIDVNAL